MVAFARKSLVWLVAAVYLLEGVLAGAAHFHGHSAERCIPIAQADVHSHAHCGHHHHDRDANNSDDRTPAVPHEHKDCAACHYSSLSAAPVALAVLPELIQSVELVASRLPKTPATTFVSLHPARAPPAAA